MKENAVALREKRELRLREEYDEQRKLFMKFNLPLDGEVMSTMRVEKRDDGSYALVKRQSRVDFVISSDGRPAGLVTRLSKTTAEKVGGLDVNLGGLSPQTAARVMDNILCSSVEPGETEAWA